jgi:hypothetical protein
VERVDLTENGEMTAKLKSIVANWFNMYSTNKKMSMD